MPRFQRTPASAAALYAVAGTLLAALAGPAAAATFNWSSGNFVPGTTAPDPLIAADVLNIQTAAVKSFNAALFTSAGTVNWLAGSGDLNFFNAASISSSGLWDAQGNASMIFGGGPASTFTNSGTLRKSAGVGTTQIGNSVLFGFVNSGTVDAQTGTIDFRGDNTFNPGTMFTGAGSVVVNSASTFNGAFSSSNLTLAAGTQTGAAAVLTGQMQLGAAVLAGDWAVTPGASLNLQGAASKALSFGSVVNHGAVVWQASSGSINFFNASSLTNNGLVDAQGNASMIFGGGPASTFTNNGVLRKSAGAGTTQIGNSALFSFVNSGTVDAQTGTIDFSGQNTFNPGTVFTGAGSVVVNSASTFNGAFSSSNLTLVSGTQTGAAAVLNGQMQLGAAVLAGDWAVAPGATLNLQGGASKTLSFGSVVNNGALVWQASSGSINFLNASSLTNNGLIDAQGNASMTYGGGPASNFTNNGVLRKSAGAGTTQIAASALFTFVNNGTVDVQTGTIQLPASFNNAGTLKGSGSFQTSGVLSNNGTLAPGSFGTGTLALTGGALAQAASATFEVDLTSLSAFDLLTVAGTAALNGTLALNCLGACSFAVGDSFTILNATGGLTGSFSSVSLAGFASGAFDVVYDIANSDVRLRVTQAVTAVPEPSTYAMFLAGAAVLGGLVRRRRPQA
jgi:hypothetical protein